MVISMTLVGSVLKDAKNLNVVFDSWFAFAVCIILCLVASYIDSIVLSYEIKLLDLQIKAQMKKEPPPENNIPKALTWILRFVNPAIAVLFLSGLSLLGKFIWLNIPTS
jgi:hypothetical protein